MDTLEFFQHVLPSEGLYVLAWCPATAPGRFRHVVVDTHADLKAAALKLDRAGHTVYHACASYAERKIWDEAKKKWRTRVARNVALVRAQWVDVDVGKEGAYPSRKDALEAVKRLCRTLHLPKPTIISSGAGLHLYWAFDRDVPASEAAPRMVQFREALAANGFKQDPSRTADLASILRPVGSHHRKGEARPVTVVTVGRSIPPERLYGTLPAVAASAGPVAQDDDDWGSGQDKNYPPSSTQAVAHGCRAVRLFIKRKAVVSEPAWRSVIGVLKHTDKGEAAIHKWSALDSRYRRAETQEKIDNYTAPPITCKHIQGTDLSPACAKCPHNGKIKTPVSLGYTADAPPPKQPVTAAAVQAPVHPAMLRNNPDPETLPFWPRGYQWDGKMLHRFVPASEDKKGEAKWRPFSQTLYYPYLRFETADATRAVRICALSDPIKNRWRDFEVEASKVAEPQALAYALGAHEVLFMPAAKNDNRQYVQDVLFGLRNSGVDTATYSSFGWHNGSFVIGDERIMPGGKVEPVFLSNSVPHAVNGSFGQKGSHTEWARIVDEVYNRPGAEPFQFAILHAIASPLVELVLSDNYYGLIVAFTGESGLAKTITALAACTFYGKPDRFIIQANEEGTTLRALLQRANTMRNLPFVLDEITGREVNEVVALLFAMANGKPKLRLRSDGSEINNGQAWALNSFVTGNVSITRMLGGSDRAKAGATQVRCFEISLDANYLHHTFKGVNAKQSVEHDLLAHNYGEAGRRFLKYIVHNRAVIEKLLHRERTRFNPKTQEEIKERFYYDMIACAMVGGKIAKKLGLISFDLQRVERWAMAHVQQLRAERIESLDTAEDLMQALLAWLQQHTVTTKFYRDGRARMDEQIVPPMREPLARIAVEDKRMLVTHKAFKDWCKLHKVNPSWLHDSLCRTGFMRPAVRRERIFKGTTSPGTFVNCVEFIYAALDNKDMVLPDYLRAIDAAEKKTAPKGGD